MRFALNRSLLTSSLVRTTEDHHFSCILFHTLAYCCILFHTPAYYSQAGWKGKRWHWLVTRIYDIQLCSACCLKMDYMLWRRNDYAVNAPHALQLLSGERLVGKHENNKGRIIIWDKHLFPKSCAANPYSRQSIVHWPGWKQQSKSGPRKSHRAAPPNPRLS